MWKYAHTMGTRQQVCFVGFGLFYGHGGFDFETLLEYCWKMATKNSLFAQSPSVNVSHYNSKKSIVGNVLATHIDDFCCLISYLVTEDNFTLPRFTPCVDSFTYMRDGFKFNNSLFLKSSGESLVLKGIIANSTMDYILNGSTQSTALMDASIKFSTTYKDIFDGMFPRRCFEGCLSEFIQYHNLSPCKLIISGAPYVGKSSVSMLIASRLVQCMPIFQ